MFERLFAKRGLSLDRMKVLLEVGDAGSIVQAAGADPVRQSQYSRQLKELEEYFGVELTERRGRTISLTAAGSELASLIREHFIALGNFSRRMQDEPVPVFIGAGESIIHWVLIPLAGRLQADIPGIALRFLNCTSTDIGNRLAHRDLDLGILRTDATTAQMSRKPVGKVGFSLYVPDQLAHVCGKTKTPALLSRLPMAVLPGETSLGRMLHQIADKSGSAVNVRLECSSFTGLAKAVESGDYAAVLPDYAAPHLATAHQQIALPALKPLTRSLTLAGQKRKAGMRPELEKVYDWLGRHIFSSR
jgi:DNA-binding transcriptional LysR family regulator